MGDPQHGPPKSFSIVRWRPPVAPVADELSGVYLGMIISIPADEWNIFRNLTQPQLIQCLRILAGNVKLSRFQKHRREPKKPAPKRISDPKTPHVSTAKLLAARKS